MAFLKLLDQILTEQDSREYAEEQAAACRRNALSCKEKGYLDLHESNLKNAEVWDGYARKARW